MRSFEQRMEEIQRRSEKIITQRRKRRLCIAAAAVPAIFCVAIILPWMLPDGVMEPDIHNEAVMESYSHMSQNESYVQVSGNSFYKNLSDPETVNQLIQLMASAVKQETNSPELEQSKKEQVDIYKDAIMDDSKDYSISTENSATSSYTITVYTGNGEIMCYQLAGDQLVSCDSTGVRILTNQELHDLRELLGIDQQEGTE